MLDPVLQHRPRLRWVVLALSFVGSVGAALLLAFVVFSTGSTAERLIWGFGLVAVVELFFWDSHRRDARRRADEAPR